MSISMNFIYTIIFILSLQYFVGAYYFYSYPKLPQYYFCLMLTNLENQLLLVSIQNTLPAFPHNHCTSLDYISARIFEVTTGS